MSSVQKHKHFGFTLIELLVVIAIIASNRSRGGGEANRCFRVPQ